MIEDWGRGIRERPLGAKQGAGKGPRREMDWRSELLQGLKPDVHMNGFIGMTEIMPCYKTFEFFRISLKSCPFKT